MPQKSAANAQKRNSMSYYLDFLENLLGDNVMRDYEKLVREMTHHQSQSKINNCDWHYRQKYLLRAQKIKKQYITHTIHNHRIRTK